MSVNIKRAYEQPHKDDGTRILVDRLWPRGLKKDSADIDIWLKEIAPTTELRQWFGHDAARWTEFQKRYKHELKSSTEQLAVIKQHMAKGKVTLIYGAKDEQHNQAVVLQRLLTAK